MSATECRLFICKYLCEDEFTASRARRATPTRPDAATTALVTCIPARGRATTPGIVPYILSWLFG
jgi:hypothetical protein